MATREELRALDPAVVDDAIERIANGLNTMSCVALLRAQGMTTYEIDQYGATNPYVKAYKENTWLLSFKPIWWNSDQDFSAPRILALEDFRDAIRAAHNRTFLECLKDWLCSPCEILTPEA